MNQKHQTSLWKKMIEDGLQNKQGQGAASNSCCSQEQCQLLMSGRNFLVDRKQGRTCQSKKGEPLVLYADL